MYTLYYSPGACSMAIHAVLNELGQDVKLEKVDLHDTASRAEFQKVNSRGQVPVLMDDGNMIREGAAIMLYLSEKHGGKLMPASGPERTEALQWLMFANATLHPTYAMFFTGKMALPEGEGKTALIKLANEKIQRHWDEIEQRLTKSPYLAGNDVSMADILVSVIANWGDTLPQPIKRGPKTQAFLAKMAARPSFRDAVSSEGVDYKAAA